jgi:hypothetical protein
MHFRILKCIICFLYWIDRSERYKHTVLSRKHTLKTIFIERHAAESVAVWCNCRAQYHTSANKRCKWLQSLSNQLHTTCQFQDSNTALMGYYEGLQ